MNDIVVEITPKYVGMTDQWRAHDSFLTIMNTIESNIAAVIGSI